ASDAPPGANVVTDAEHAWAGPLTPDSRACVERVLAYHGRTKHHPHRYADSPGRLDWATQPDPFRTYAGAPVTELPLLADAVTATYADLYVPGRVRPRRPDVHSVAILF